jgi:hypothetical protein
MAKGEKVKPTIHCLMAKGEKVKPKSKPSSLPSDESSDEEIDQVSNLDKQSRAVMAKLVRELDKTHDVLISERSELGTLRLEVVQAEGIIATLKEGLSTSQAQCNSLKSRNEEFGEKYSLVWSSTSNPSKV